MNQLLRPTLAASAALVLVAGMSQAATIAVQSVGVTSSADLSVDNDFTRVNNAVTAAADGDIIELEGMFDWSQSDAYAGASAVGGVEISDISNLTIKAKDGTVSGFTMSDVAALRTEDPANLGSPLQTQQSYFVPWSNTTNLVIDGLVFENGNYSIWTNYSSTSGLDGITIQNCEIIAAPYNAPFEIAGWALNTGVYVGSYTPNVSIINNTFTAVNNACGTFTTEFEGSWPDIRLINSRFSQDNLTITGNTFQVVNDPAMPNADKPVVMSRVFGLVANGSSNNGNYNYTCNDNTFDGGVDIGGTDYPLMTIGVLNNCPTGEYDATKPGVSTYDNNTFENVLTAYQTDWVFSPDNINHILPIKNNVFTNCGWTDTVLDPWLTPDTPLHDRYTDRYPGKSVIKNLTGSSTYGDEGPIKVYIKLPFEVDGQIAYFNSGSDFSYVGLHEIANQESFFSAVPDGSGGFIDAGVYAVEVVDPALTPIVDPIYNGLRRFSAPPGELDEVVGYTVIGDVDPTEPPVGRSVDEYSAGNVPDNTVVEIPFGTTLDIVPGTIIDQNITFRGVAAPIKYGADAPMAVIEPTNLNFSAALFEVSAGSLTLENVMLKGVSDALPGTMNVLKGVRVDGAATVTLENVSSTGFVADIVDLTENSSGAVVSLDDCHIYNSAKGLATYTGTSVTINETLFDDVGLPLSIRRGDVTMTKNVFVDTPAMWINSPAVNFTYGGMAEGNLNFGSFTPGFGGLTSVGSGTTEVSYNWLAGAYGEGTNDDAGLIVGDVDVYGPGNDVVAGTISWSHVSSENPPLTGESFIAQFDRDLDAYPDAWEIGGVTGYTVFDSDNDGWPDGVEIAEGTNPNDNADFPAGTFDINADLDANGFADWYEDALMANCGINPFIGNVERTGSVGLTDAVRSLQIVNGAFGDKDMRDGDLNALDVTALGPNSLGNPLQILRFQAGVRNKLPALSGID